MKTAKEQFYEHGGDEEEDPIERLRFFCSCAIHGQDWLDIEQFFDDITTQKDAEPSIVVGTFTIRIVDELIFGIEDRDGDGMLLPISKLEAVLTKFWKEEF